MVYSVHVRAVRYLRIEWAIGRAASFSCVYRLRRIELLAVDSFGGSLWVWVPVLGIVGVEEYRFLFVEITSFDKFHR